MNKILIIVFFLLLSCATCFGQSSFQGITPGKSTRADVERALGQPASKVSETLIQYKGQQGADKIFVQYRDNSATAIVERIELTCAYSGTGSKCNPFHLSIQEKYGVSLSTADARRQTSEAEILKQKTLYYFGEPRYIVFTYPPSRGDIYEIRWAFYSKELFESVAPANAKAGGSRMNPEFRAQGIIGIVKLNGSPVAGATIDLYRTDLPGHYANKTDRYGNFVFAGLIGTYVAVASGPGMKWTYVSVQVPLTSPVEIIAEAGDGTRPSQEQVFAAIK